MLLDYPERRSLREIQTRSEFYTQLFNIEKSTKSLLFSGDNFQVLSCLCAHKYLLGSVDFIYIDPPYSTGTIFTGGNGRYNSVSMGEHGDVMYNDTLKGGAFLEFLRERLYLMHKLLSPQGSLYLHIDYKIGHYVKIILDEIFGMDNFRADLSRIKCNPKNFKRNNFGNIKDLILFYTKTDTYIWNEQRGKFSESQIEKLYPKIDDRGNRYTTVPIHAPGATKDGVTGRPWRDILPPEGRHWRYPPQELEKLDQSGRIEWSKNGNPRLKQFAKDAVANGFKFQDILEYKDPFNPKYPTEKNLDLLRMLIRTSSNPNSIILDSFAGSGTTLIAAVQEGRKFIGIDESEHAIRIITDRLQAQTYRDWQLIGNPVVSCK